ncbi:hypothetical protein A7985_02155 [Pseudoalteromonas luteoviolacea]|uniref:Uncharacterized protein n=1 Tax=Pseudoalteromonas luteoviolacea TaxID=43657 RepID=A0A1C0TTZ6_9GAMM|nr:hypothetical protein [Pseudoalteromonas luteoviolacea]OCQ22782.1 hypothetical protein A7985_02155 [Pseudoalteromonas luteoviolacea]
MNIEKTYRTAILLLVTAMGGTIYKYWDRELTELIVLSIPYLFVLILVMVEKANNLIRHIRSIYTPLLLTLCYTINFKFESIHLHYTAILMLILGQLTIISIGEFIILFSKRQKAFQHHEKPKLK